MCGIAGFAGRPAAEASDAVFDRIAHRGPDGRGRFDSACGTVSLFHTRLAIQDPTPAGAQPMAGSDGRVVIVYNGEIYNVRELRKELEGRGHSFRSHTDTEVLLALYLEHGEAMFGKLNGIFAFALWDARSSSLLVARDGFGVKPLYFSESGGAFAFASEIKALLCFPWVPRNLDVQALAQYVRHLWCPAPRSPLSDVKKVEPGEAILVRGGRIVKRWRHYVLPAPGPDPGPSEQDWASEVRRSLESAVERQMISDVPLGAFLSGGLDSSAISALARKHAAGRLQCFTIDFDESMAREEGFLRDLPFAERVARHLDVDLHVVRVGPEMAGELERMVWHLDEPQADLAALNVLFISRLARSKGIKVLLSGTGADDIFAGYRRHRALGLNAVWDRIPRSVRGSLAGMGRRLPSGSPMMRRVSKLLAAAGLNGDSRLLSYFDWAPAATVGGLFVPGLAEALHENPLQAALDVMPSTATPLQRMLLLEQRFFLADHNLNYTDKMSMAAGVEARVPFLDRDLVAIAARIPDRFRQHGAQGKWVLKKAVADLLPDDVIHRPKTGFGVPLRAWLRGPLKPMMHDLLSPASLRRRGVFEPAAVAALMAEFETGRGDHAYSLLSLMCIEVWCRQFLGTPAGGICRRHGMSEQAKLQVRNFWQEAACGERLLLRSIDRQGFAGQSAERYRLEPFIPEFARFEQWAGKRVLEIGVGLGADHQRFVEAGARTSGIDLTPRAIELTEKRMAAFGLSSDLKVGDAEALDFPRGEFDLVWSWGVLHHSPDTGKAISEVFRVLKPGGLARIMIYNKYSLVGFMLWVRYALLRMRPVTSLRSIYARHLESPGTKAYSVAEARGLLSRFDRVTIRTVLSHGDLLSSGAGQRHRGVLLRAARLVWPRWFISRFLRGRGLFAMIEARKPAE